MAGKMGLDELERAVARDLRLVAHPRRKWLQPRRHHGAPVLDVLVVGAGQCGLAAGFALRRDQVDNIALIDRAPAGREGPWTSFARMPCLRSPKDQTGPDQNIPSLTYQSWHEARFGAADFAAMALIPTALWQEYLAWFRQVTALPVRNDTSLADIAPAQADDGSAILAARLGDGALLHARKIVLATGQDGTGAWWMPDFLRALPPAHRAHTADPIDFAALRGRVVAVLGAGASAMDNAATALEAGAAAVHLFCRRAAPPVVQPFRWLTFAGFMKHIGEMDDAWRWRFLSHILGMGEGFPQTVLDRVAAHANFTLHTNTNWTGAALQDGQVRLTAPGADFLADFVIAGTGIGHDCALRPELRRAAGNIATWADRYTPPPAERNHRLGRFPYLSADFAFTEKQAGLTPWVADIHLFGVGTTMSFGPSGSSINAMSTAVPRLVAGVTRGLFRADLQRNWESLLAYDEAQVLMPQRDLAAG